MTFLVLVGSGIAGSIFGDLISPDANRTMLKTGLNPCLFGVVGCGLGYLLINWESLRLIGWVFKFKVASNLIFAFMFLIIFADEANTRDFGGQLGGFLAGLFMSGMLPSIRK